MTPKEKAQELVAKMENDFQYFASMEIAIQHALIAVDEITDVLVDLSFSEFTLINDVVYWNEVKQEIKKL